MTNISFFLTLVFLVVLSSLSLSSPTDGAEEDMLVRAIQLRENHEEVAALQLFEQILAKEPDNYQALLNAGFLHFRQGWLYREKGSAEQKQHFLKLGAYAERALELKPGEYQAKLLHAVAKAKTSSFLQPGDQVRIAKELSRDLPPLIASAGTDPAPIYIFSWLNMKVGMVGSFERMMASMFFDGLPEDLTTDKAVTLIQQAIELRPDYSVYYYDLALFRQQLGQVAQARELFEKVLGMEPKTPEEEVYRKWAEQRVTELAKDDTK